MPYFLTIKKSNMSRVISFISQKGGVGKSTVTTLIANLFFFKHQLSIAIVDADFPQNSISKRREKELRIIKKKKRLEHTYHKIYHDLKPYPIIKTNLESCAEVIRELKIEYDYIFVDVAGSLNQEGIIPFLREVNYFYIPILQDDFSTLSALELYMQLTTKIKPVSEEFRSCKLFFNKVPAKNKMVGIRKNFETNFEFLDDHINAYTIYERVYRSTLFPIPEKAQKPNLKIHRFANSIMHDLETVSSEKSMTMET